MPRPRTASIGRACAWSPGMRSTIGCGCSVRHQRTDMLMIGMSRNADDGEDGRVPRSLLVGLVRDAAREQVAGVEQQQDERARQARIPRPPRAPDRPPPDRASRERKHGEQHADVGRRARHRVEAHVAPPQHAPPRRRSHPEREVHGDRRRHVDVEEALHLALDGLARSDDHRPDDHREHRDAHERRKRDPAHRIGTSDE